MTSVPEPAAGPPVEPNQFRLLGQRRFAPFFWVQCLNAANDNLFKFAFTVMVTYQVQVSWLPATHAGLVIGALFILPYLLFSATAGQLADKYDKARVMRAIKSLEIVLMALAGWGFLQSSVPVMLAGVFLMGVHSTFFGPVKFAYLPQHLNERELTGGNGLVEAGTFIAILLGQVAGGALIALPANGASWTAWACCAIAVIGRVIAQALPVSPPDDPGLRLAWNPIPETRRNLRLAQGNPVVFRSLLGIAWMWFFGAVFLGLFPAFARDVLGGDEQVASLLLVVFSLGVGGGALLCESLSRRHVEIGLVPLGALGMTVFAIDLWAATRGLPPSTGREGLAAFLARPEHWRVLAGLFGLSFFAGLYSVPMSALLQVRCEPHHRARILAASNILNALFMIASAVLVGAALRLGLTIPQVFGLVGLLNAVMAAWIFLLVPDYLLRFLAFGLSRVAFRLRVVRGERIPSVGPAVLLCAGARPLDALLLIAASPRPLRFVLDARCAELPLLGGLFGLARAVFLPPAAADATAWQVLRDRTAAALDAGELLVLLRPEREQAQDPVGRPLDGWLLQALGGPGGPGRGVPVLPLLLRRGSGSRSTRTSLASTSTPADGIDVALHRPERRLPSRVVTLVVGERLDPLVPGTVIPCEPVPDLRVA